MRNSVYYIECAGPEPAQPDYWRAGPVFWYHYPMAKKKKKQTSAKTKKEIPFNNPFLAMKKDLKQAAKTKGEAPAPAPVKQEPEENEQALFSRAMAGVARLDSKDRGITPRTPGNRKPRLDAQPDEDLEVLAQLADLISGEGEFDLRMSDEYVQGAAPGVGPKLIKRLARGDFPVQDYLDLHGMGEDQALNEVRGFLTQSVARGLRHVLLVHGRGLRSPGGVPVLKTALARNLSHKRFQKTVLAFCTAQAVDGGTGAMYVLLRKWTGPKT